MFLPFFGDICFLLPIFASCLHQSTSSVFTANMLSCLWKFSTHLFNRFFLSSLMYHIQYSGEWKQKNEAAKFRSQYQVCVPHKQHTCLCWHHAVNRLPTPFTPPPWKSKYCMLILQRKSNRDNLIVGGNHTIIRLFKVVYTHWQRECTLIGYIWNQIRLDIQVRDIHCYAARNEKRKRKECDEVIVSQYPKLIYGIFSAVLSVYRVFLIMQDCMRRQNEKKNNLKKAWNTVNPCRLFRRRVPSIVFRCLCLRCNGTFVSGWHIVHTDHTDTHRDINQRWAEGVERAGETAKPIEWTENMLPRNVLIYLFVCLCLFAVLTWWIFIPSCVSTFVKKLLLLILFIKSRDLFISRKRDHKHGATTHCVCTELSTEWQTKEVGSARKEIRSNVVRI